MSEQSYDKHHHAEAKSTRQMSEEINGLEPIHTPQSEGSTTVEQLQREVAQLRRERRALLNEIASLRQP